MQQTLRNEEPMSFSKNRVISVRCFGAIAAILTCCVLAYAEDHVLVLQVIDTLGKPIAGVVLGLESDGSIGPPTDNGGKTRISLNSKIKLGSEVSLRIVSAEHDMVFISPWDNRVRVGSFENTSQNVVQVVLAERGDRTLLQNGQALVALVSRINAANAPKAVGEVPAKKLRRYNLSEVAKAYGLEAEEVDRAIRAWGESTKDPYERGLAALYAENYVEATKQLSESLQMREGDLERTRLKVADAAFFLGRTLYRRRRYLEAEESYRKALTIQEELLGPKHPTIAITLESFAALMRKLNRISEAQDMEARAKAIRNVGRRVKPGSFD
jgi:TolA-binding protein